MSYLGGKGALGILRKAPEWLRHRYRGPPAGSGRPLGTVKCLPGRAGCVQKRLPKMDFVLGRRFWWVCISRHRYLTIDRGSRGAKRRGPRHRYLDIGNRREARLGISSRYLVPVSHLGISSRYLILGYLISVSHHCARNLGAQNLLLGFFAGIIL